MKHSKPMNKNRNKWEMSQTNLFVRHLSCRENEAPTTHTPLTPRSRLGPQALAHQVDGARAQTLPKPRHEVHETVTALRPAPHQLPRWGRSGGIEAHSGEFGKDIDFETVGQASRCTAVQIVAQGKHQGQQRRKNSFGLLQLIAGGLQHCDAGACGSGIPLPSVCNMCTEIIRQADDCAVKNTATMQ